jgi:hypothetical protein
MTEDQDGKIRISGDVKLKNGERETVQGSASDFRITYLCSENSILIQAKTTQAIQGKTSFTLPIISKNDEKVDQPEENLIIISKPGGRVKISANVPLSILETEKNRTFNMVPGVEALPIQADFISDSLELIITVI